MLVLLHAKKERKDKERRKEEEEKVKTEKAKLSRKERHKTNEGDGGLELSLE